MDVERSLVSAVARTQSMTAVMGASIEPHHFIQRQKGSLDPAPLPGEVYAWILGHYRRFKAVPSLALTMQRWPTFEFIDSSDTLDALVSTFRGQVNRRILIDGIRQLSDIADDPTKWDDADVHAFAVAAELARAMPSASVTRLSDSMSRLEMHKARQLEGKVPGITLATPELNALTYGVGIGELLIWEGFLGGGKSTMSMIQSATEYAERDRSSLVLSLEMEGHKLASRWDAAMAGFRYKALKFMEMRDEDYDKWARFAERVAAARFEKDVVVVDDIFRCSSERIYSEVEKWRPDFFIVDTVDEINAPSFLRSKWERSDYTARELKAVCRATKKPGIGIAQSGREAEDEGARLGNVADSVTINRKADLVVGLHCTPTMKRSNMLILRMLKNRDGEGDGLEYTYFRDPSTLTLRPWTPADAVPSKNAAPA